VVGLGRPREWPRQAELLEYLETDSYQVRGRTVHLSGEAKSLAMSSGDKEAEQVAVAHRSDQEWRGQAGEDAAVRVLCHQPGRLSQARLHLAYTLESVGVGAYNGDGPSLANKKLLAAAGSIVQVEARHAAAIAVLTGSKITPNGAFDKS
jgi:Ferritin-like domain